MLSKKDWLVMSAFGVGKEMAAWVLNVYIFRFGYLIYHFHFYFGELGGGDYLHKYFKN